MYRNTPDSSSVSGTQNNFFMNVTLQEWLERLRIVWACRGRSSNPTTKRTMLQTLKTPIIHEDVTIGNRVRSTARLTYISHAKTSGTAAV